jgi:RNA polymerase sigma-70 factor (ECF subfamily)
MQATTSMAVSHVPRQATLETAHAALTAQAALMTQVKGGSPVAGDAGTSPYGDSGGWDVISSTGPTPIGRVSKAGKAQAEQLFAAHYPKLAGWVRRLVDDDETAHEIASEAFVRLLSRWTKPSNLDSPQSYLYMIATNLVRDHWRKMERERRAMRTVTAGGDLEPTVDPAQDVDVRELLMGLPAKLREPFVLHYYAGFGVREIAVLLKRPEGTIKADLYHARNKLKESLEARGTARRPQSPKGGKARDAR